MHISIINQQLYTPKIKSSSYQTFGSNKIMPKIIDFGADIFEKSVKVDETPETLIKHLNNINNRIKDRIIGFTPEQLEQSINEVKLAHPDITEKQTLTVMQRLTQWADYSCFYSINHQLKPFENGFTSSEFDHKNKVMHYLQQKMIINKNSWGKRPYFIDSKNIDLLEDFQIKKGIFINLEGFEDGINFLSDNTDLATKTIKVISKIKNHIKEKNFVKFNDALNNVLNKELLDKAKDKNIEVHTFRRKLPATRETILKQMRPIQPKHPDVIKILIETIAQKYTQDNPKEFQKLQNFIAQFYDYKFLPFSKQGMIEDLKQLHEQIDKLLTEKNIPAENRYLLTVDSIKSYDIISEMFSKIAKIPEENILELRKITDLNKYKDGKNAFIIVDDMSISGISLAEFADYYPQGHKLSNNIPIIFAPISIHEHGLDHINDTIRSLKREDTDKLITLPKNVVKRFLDDDYFNMTRYFYDDHKGSYIMGYPGYENSLCATVFPYTTPDNNCAMASFLTKYFLPKDAYIDSIHQDFYNIQFAMNHSEKMTKLLNFIKILGEN